MTNPAVFKFNVGGTLYTVSQSLVNSFPNTLLAKSASTQWNEDPNTEIFIERDGSRFQYVLDYMRDGRVSLPVGASKDAMLGDLAYYEFENVNVNSIADTAATTFLAGKTLSQLPILLSSWKAKEYEHECQVNVHKNAAAVLEAYTAQRTLSLLVKEKKGGWCSSFKHCNELLKSAGLCVEQDAWNSDKETYSVTLKLL